MTKVQPMTTIESALQWSHALLQDVSDTYQMEARLLLCHVLQVSREYLIRYPDKVLTAQQASDFQSLVTQRSRGKPIAYLLGRQGFYDIEVFVTPDVLIPRPETEMLVERAIEQSKGKHAFIVDVGAGSGVIALVLAKHLPTAHITGIDLSAAALDIAKQNSEHLGVESRIRWIQGNLLRPIIENRETVDLIVANLPYIAEDELPALDVVRYEPYMALSGGADGLDVIRRFFTEAPQVLREQGSILMEIGTGQGEMTKQIAQAAFPNREVMIEPDLVGHDRLLVVKAVAT